MSRVCVVFLIILLPAAGLLAQSRAEKPSDFTIELGGRCLIYSLSYQRMITEQAGLEIGASMLGGSNASIIFLSGGARIYFTKKNAAPCLAGGIVYVTAGTSAGPFSDDSESGVYFFVSPGFEYRVSGGFLFRGSVNFLIKDGFFVWPGLTLGIAF